MFLVSRFPGPLKIGFGTVLKSVDFCRNDLIPQESNRRRNQTDVFMLLVPDESDAVEWQTLLFTRKT